MPPESPRRGAFAIWLVAVLAGCTAGSVFDFDLDGSVDSEDCAPQDPTIYPGAAEQCADGIDQDCDDRTDMADPDCWIGNGAPDTDDDADGLSEQDGDCDDTDPTVFGGATEVCDDLDNDCDGEIDEDCVPAVADLPTVTDIDGWDTSADAYGAVRDIVIEPGVVPANVFVPSDVDSSHAGHRFADAWLIQGTGLDTVSEIRLLAAPDGACPAFEATGLSFDSSYTGASDMRQLLGIELPGLCAGLFTLVLLSPASPVQAQVFVLQGEQGVAGNPGSDGADGLPGVDGSPGDDGAAGPPGLACWDANGDGIQDPAEDVTVDGAWDTADCVGLPAGVPLGTIMPFGGDGVLSGWLLCDGSGVSVAGYPALYAAIGDAWGGDGGTNFNLPDLRGRFLRGVDGGAGTDPDAGTRAASNAGGNSGDAVGSVQDDEIGTHDHSHSNGTTPSSNGSFLPLSWTANNATAPDTFTTGVAGGSESRPNNAAVRFFIRAE